MAAQQPDAWQRQDGQIISRMQPGGPSHAQERWDERVVAEAGRPDLEGVSVRVAWRESQPIASGFGWAKRAHESGMVLVSEWACLMTAYYAEHHRVGGDE